MQNRSFIGNLKKGISKRIRGLFHNPYAKTGLSWMKIKQLKHLPSGQPRQQDFFGKILHFIDPPELLHGIKEIFVEEIYKQTLPPTAYIIDCGANIGLSVIYMKQLYPDAKIIAFEPDAKNFALLEKNVSSFQCKNVSLRKEAVWIADTELYFATAGSMSSKIEQEATSSTTIVKATRLKNLLTEPVDFLKIDIEGAEYAVLEDIRENLHNVKNLFIEYHGSFAQNNELTSIFNWIQQQGFSYYIKEAAPIYPTPFQRNDRVGFDYDVQLNIFCFRKN
ncbi:FkbM family methyltransferase [Ferruginibacter sp.]